MDIKTVIRIDLENNNLEGCIPEIYINLCNGFSNFKKNPLLPWVGDFKKFCETDGSTNSQIGAPCNNGTDVTKINQIDASCNCK